MHEPSLLIDHLPVTSLVASWLCFEGPGSPCDRVFQSCFEQNTFLSLVIFQEILLGRSVVSTIYICIVTNGYKTLVSLQASSYRPRERVRVTGLGDQLFMLDMQEDKQSRAHLGNHAGERPRAEIGIPLLVDGRLGLGDSAGERPGAEVRVALGVNGGLGGDGKGVGECVHCNDWECWLGCEVGWL